MVVVFYPNKQKGVAMAKKFMFLGILFLLGVGLINCGGGGGGGGDDSTSPKLAIAIEDTSAFGNVIVNDSAVKRVTLTNSGSAALKISNVTANPLAGFELLPGTCGGMPITLDKGASCTFSITFNPTEAKQYSTTLTITSNAAGSPHTRAFSGTGVDLAAALNVDLKAVVCDAGQLKAYVQVSDEQGDAIETLGVNDFGLVIDTAAAVPPDSAVYKDSAQANLPISVAFLMDQSGSVTSDQDLVDAMQAAGVAFVDGLDGDDEAEIIKFTGTPDVVQPFTDDKTLLKTAINADFNPADPADNDTALYDALWQALQDTIKTQADKSQRAIVILTDGIDTDGTATVSVKTPDEVIKLAQDEEIKIFTISIGSYTNDPELRLFAEETGGQFFKVEEAADLANTVNDDLLVLFQNVYELPFDAAGGNFLMVDVQNWLSDTLAIPACP
jgi:VWFA-related protein